jgi:hypothetical protein
MATLPLGVWLNTLEPLYYPLAPSTVSIKNVRGNIAIFSTIVVSSISTLNITQLNAESISAGLAYISSISTTNITIGDNTINTGGISTPGAPLLLNGVPIATTDNLSSIADWAYDPAISTVQMDGNDLRNAGNIDGVNLTVTNSVSGVIGGFTTVNSGGITNSGNILTNTIQATGLINAASVSTANLKANLITAGTTNTSTLVGIKATLGSISTNTLSTATIATGTIVADTGNYSSITVSTITAGSVIVPVDPNLIVSSITVNGSTSTATLSVASGANFAGSRPNFTTGINSSGANNFNNTNLDNCGQINAGALSLFGSATVGILADSGGSILTNTAISLATQNGGSSVINIEAKRNALTAYPIPLSQVNIVAEGNCPNIPIVPLTPYGGAINITAYQGPDPIFPLTPITNVAAPGAIHLTAYSKGAFPGLITEAAGSILAYSGLTNPTIGLYGCSFYSALNCLSLTCGITPAAVSYPGVVYLRGDAGTKVLNGLYIDHLYPASGYTLAISGAGGSNVTLNDVSFIGMTTNPVLDGGNGAVRNFSSITAGTIQANTLNINSISTGSLTLPQLYTSFININPQSTVYISHPDLTINANLTTDEGEDPQPNNLNLFASSNINIQSYATGGGGGDVNIACANNPIFSINLTGDTYVSRTLNVGRGISTTNVQLSTINGVAYPIADAFVSTATSALNMNGFNISSIGSLYLSTGAYIDGSYSNQFNFNASNSYFLGNLRFYGSGRTLDIADNIIQNVSYIYGNTSGFLNLNANFGMVIETNLGAELRFNTDRSIRLKTLSTAQIEINQTSGSDFILFNSGDTRMRAVRNAYVEAVGDAFLIAGLNVDIRAPTTQYVTLQQTGVGAQSYFQLTPGGNVVLNARTYFEAIAPSGVYFTSPFTEVRGYLTFNTSNNYINNLRHIYGDTSAPGNGLAIDYMYGMFFNSSGRNANLYIDSGNLNMINYNSGINIANYNPNGTGGVTLFSASNFVNVGTGTGYDVNLNGGRYVSVNAAQPGGAFNIYASTINATSLVATNVTIGQDLNITATGSAQLRASYFNFFNDCYFNNRNLHDMGNIYFGYGVYISRNTPGGYTNAFLDIVGAGGDGQLRLINGSAEVALRANSDLGITPTSGYNIVLNGPTTANSNINMNGKSITNVSTISMLSNATITSPNIINFTAPSTFMTGSLYFNPASTSEIDLKDGYLRNASYITNPFTTNIQAFTGLYLTSAVRANITAPAVRIEGDVDHVNCNVSFISQLRSLSTLNNSIDGVNLNINAPSTIISGTVQRILSARNVTQPILQYDVVASSGNSGSIVVTLPTAYTSVSSFVAFACMEDPDPAEISVVRNTASEIEIFWQTAGGGSHSIAWNCMGT